MLETGVEMRPSIPHRYYYDEVVFQQEQKQLFATTWQFAGFRKDVADDQAMFCTDIAGLSIVIKNFKGQLRAFHNICSHRFSPICNGPSRGPLQCPYHGWTYDESGLPYAIPKRKTFVGLDPQEFKLQAYEVDVIGVFIFIKMQPGGLALREYLSAAVTVLEQASEAMGNLLDRNEMIIDANWKLIVENSIEDYHVRDVHPESLYAVGIRGSTPTLQGIHSTLLIHLETQLASNKKLETAYASRPWKQEDFLHQLIFPNLAVATTFGTTVSVQHVMPLSAARTRFVSYVFSTPLKSEGLTSTAQLMIKAFNQKAVDFNRQVFLEDRAICEGIQKRIPEAGVRRGILGENEVRVWALHQAYMNVMKGAAS